MSVAASDRRGGILLHPTSLPGPYGIGDLRAAAEWLGWLSDSGCRLWQILPLVPTGQGNSPYDGSSAFAGNPQLISLDLLIEDELLSARDLKPVPEFPTHFVEHEAAREYKQSLLRLAANRFHQGAAEHMRSEYQTFCHLNRSWLEDYALFRALKEMHDETAWSSWDPRYSDRSSPVLDFPKDRWEEQSQRHRFYQFIFFRQWERLRRQAASVGVSIIGDIPIFVAHDSSDVWAHRELFQLDEYGNPTVVAGVPPDYFSRTGQRWGNPLYAWEVLEAQGFGWWIERMRSALTQVDFVRLDHFRGFEAHWEIPRDAPTAATGMWVQGPGERLFNALQTELGQLPAVAEDLGVITPEVIALRDQFELPGMRILQFGLEGGPDHADLPHNYVAHCVAYTGTHDNDTSRSWYETSSSEVRAFARKYLSCNDDAEIAERMIASVWASEANWSVAPLQDFLGLGREARMNFPGTIEGNWAWRVSSKQLSVNLAAKIRELHQVYDR